MAYFLNSVFLHVIPKVVMSYIIISQKVRGGSSDRDLLGSETWIIKILDDKVPWRDFRVFVYGGVQGSVDVTEDILDVHHDEIVGCLLGLYGE